MVNLTTLATDIVVFGYSPTETSLRILLIHRSSPPYQGFLAIPGGRVEEDEDAETPESAKA